MAKLVSISPDDRLIERVLSRSPDEGTDELRHCITSFNDALARLSREYPGCVAIGSFTKGRSCESMVLTASKDYLHWSPVAPERMRSLARLIASLPEELRSAFEIEFNSARAREKLLAEAEARSAALAAGPETRSE
jgi:hypothetical protein